jgi:TonB family protein
MSRHYGCLAALALAITALPVGAQAVIRDGVTYHEAGNVILSVVPDSFDGVHLYADPREGATNAEVGLRGRFDPTQLTTWLEGAEAAALDSMGAVPEGREWQSPMLSGIDGTMGLVVGRLWKNGRSGSTLYWVLRGADRQAPLLIEADVAFSRRLAVALRAAATHSSLDSAAFASGLVEPIGDFPSDSLGVRPHRIPAPWYPPKMQSRRTNGVVEVRYVVDTTGRVDMRTFEVLGATDAAFIPPVKDALSHGRFHPARHHGATVRRWVRQRIRFRVR